MKPSLPVLAVLTLAALTTSVPSGGSTAAVAPAPAASRCDLPGPYDYPQGSEPVHLDPADFTTRIDNPWSPMRPGTTRVYRETSGREIDTVRVTVTRRTRMIAGVRARVVHDVVRHHGDVVEDTWDWYAQDSGGNVWYLGERTREYDDGEVSTEGSWEHGKHGAYAGILVSARPRAGCRYREEYRAGTAEDNAVVLARHESFRVHGHHYGPLVHTSNTTPLEPGALENKFYARGVGPVVEVTVAPGLSRAVLVRVTRR